MTALAIEAGEHRCLRCRRLLRARTSVVRGYGPVCAARVGRAAATLERLGGRVGAKAAELLVGGGLVPSSHRGVWLVPSSDGTRTYRAHARGCSCPAGVHQRLCAHRCGAVVLAA